MIDNNNVKIYLNRFILYVIACFGFMLIESDSFVYDLIQISFAILLVADIVLELLIIIKNFTVLKLIIIVINILVKLILVIVFITVKYSTLFADDLFTYVYFNVMLLGIIGYPIAIIKFFIDTYKEETVNFNKPVLLVLLSGIILLISQFFVKVKYSGIEGFEYMTEFNFSNTMIIIYTPIILISLVYVLTLFPSKKEENIIE